MEKVFGEIIGMFLVSGTVGIYALLSLVLMIVGYYKYFKPFRKDFDQVKIFIDAVPKEHEEFSKQIDHLEKIINNNNNENITIMKEGLRDSDLHNSNEHRNIGVEFSKIKYLIEELARKEEKFFDKNNSTFNDIMVILSKLETKLDYQNQQGLGGIRK